MRYFNASRPFGSPPASFTSAHCSATPRAQKKICFLTAPPASAFSSTRAYIFSYSRGTESTSVGRTVCMSIGTVSIDSAYAMEQPTWNIR